MTSFSRVAASAGIVAAFMFATWFAPSAAGAQPENKDTSSSYWHVSFLGGLLTPLKDMGDSHKQGLVAGGRVGWTGNHGFGLVVTGDYSPLPRKNTGNPRESFTTHFGLVTGEASLTLKWKSLRIWASGGGGIAAERTRRYEPEGVKQERVTDFVPAVVGSAGLEFHVLSSGGLAVVASYARMFGDLGMVPNLEYEIANLTAGLVFAFK